MHFLCRFQKYNFFLIRCHLPCPLFSLNWLLTPVKVKNKIVPIMGFMVFKSTGFDSRFQPKKCPKSAFQTKTSKIWHILADILGLGAYFSNPIFSLKPWVQACRFEYHKPCELNEIVFSYTGSLRILKRKSTQLKFLKFYFF